MSGYWLASFKTKQRMGLVADNTAQYLPHYDDVIMTMLASQITSLTVVYSIVYSGVNQRKHQSSASQAFVREIHRGPVNFPHKWPVTRKMFPFDDVIMNHSFITKGWTHWNRSRWINRHFQFRNPWMRYELILFHPHPANPTGFNSLWPVNIIARITKFI